MFFDVSAVIGSVMINVSLAGFKMQKSKLSNSIHLK